MKIIVTLVIGLLLFVMFFIWLPIHIMNEAECLDRGFANSRTTYALQGYCINRTDDKVDVVRL